MNEQEDTNCHIDSHRTLLEDVIAAAAHAGKSYAAVVFAEVSGPFFQDLTPLTFDLLCHIGQDYVRPAALAKRAGISIERVRRLLADLEARYYLEVRQDPYDARAKTMVSLCDRGIAVLEASHYIKLAIARRTAAYIGDEQMCHLRSALEQIFQSLEQCNPPSEDI